MLFSSFLIEHPRCRSRCNLRDRQRMRQTNLLVSKRAARNINVENGRERNHWPAHRRQGGGVWRVMDVHNHLREFFWLPGCRSILSCWSITGAARRENSSMLTHISF